MWNIIRTLNSCFLCEYVLNCNLFLWSKLYFQHHYCSLQCHMIFRNHNNMLICCSRNISDYYQCWNYWNCAKQHLSKICDKYFFFFKKCIILFIKVSKFIKSVSKDFYNVTNYFSNKCFELELSIHQRILCSTTVFNIDNNQKFVLSSKSAYYYDFWRSCDTEDCSNDAENTALLYINKLFFLQYIQTENS